MLQTLSDGLRNSKILAGIVIAIIVVPFALWGIGSYIRGGGTTYAAMVNDVEISAQDLERAYVQQRNRLQEMFGGRLPAQFADGALIRRQALDSLVNRELLLQYSLGNGYRVSDTTLAQTLLQVDAFLVDGKFDQARYEMQLRSQGMSPGEFEQSTRASILLEQLRRSVAASDFLLPEEKTHVERLRGQQRSLKYLKLPLADEVANLTVSDAEIETYYQEHTAEFASPEQVKIEYLELDERTLAEKVAVSDEELMQLYESQKQQFTTQEERNASHILLAVAADAEAAEVEARRTEIENLRQRILAGESFAELAREYSEDPGSAPEGGDLGSVVPGLMVEEFESALFALSQVGEVSEPVRSQFGFHLIKLDGITPGGEQPFEEVRAQLEEELQGREAENLFYDRAELLGNLSYENPDSLVPAAEATGLSIQSSDWVDAGTSTGIGRFPRLRSAALSAEAINERRNSDLLELGSNHVVVFRVTDHRPSAPLPLEAVREQVRAAVARQKAVVALREKADDALQAIKDGEQPEVVAGRTGGQWVDAGLVQRGAAEDRGLLSELFSLPRPGTGATQYAVTAMANGDLAVLVFDEVVVPEAVGEDDTASQAMERARGSRSFEAWLQHLRETADIRVSDNPF